MFKCIYIYGLWKYTEFLKNAYLNSLKALSTVFHKIPTTEYTKYIIKDLDMNRMYLFSLQRKSKLIKAMSNIGRRN